ncbi:MAG TPA: arylesterase [Hyphomicrobiaceae bacterium]|nr:arylesterase [Hyphomicrobiaceae bacterium]
MIFHAVRPLAAVRLRLAVAVGQLVLAAALLAPASAVAERPIRIIAFGDSLVAGYRLPNGEAFPAQLQKALQNKGYPVEVVASGVSGDTTGAGLARIDWALADSADAVILELGANDALRGIDPAVTRRNLEAIIERIEAKGAKILLAGMKAPRNWGSEYVKKFEAIYPELADKHRLVLYPFFLEGVALDPALILDDGLHPNAKGVARIVAGILPSVEKLIAEIEAGRRAAGR